MLPRPHILIISGPALALALTSTAPGCESHLQLRQLVLPVTGTGTQLPGPPSDVSLKRIALGFGIQNYSCADVGASPTATGALAMLYDIAKLYPQQSPQSLSQSEFDSLTSKVLSSHQVPLNFNRSAEGRVSPTTPGACLTQPFGPDAPLDLAGLQPLPFLGRHFFDSHGAPNFVLDDGDIHMVAKKLASVEPPPAADPGPDNVGAVSWLYLGASDGSVGAKYVYRVLTAGGASHGCTRAAGQDSSKYTAMYWFYD